MADRVTDLRSTAKRLEPDRREDDFGSMANDPRITNTIGMFVRSYLKTHAAEFRGERGDRGDTGLQVDEDELRALIDDSMRRYRVNHFGGMAQVGRMDSSSIDFLQSGTGAIATTVQEDLRARAINAVTQFGVSTTNTGAQNVTRLTAALDAANTANKAVYIPGDASVYPFNAAVPIPAGTTLFGDGKDNTILEFDHTGNGLTNIGAVDTNRDVYIHISDLYLKATSGSQAGGGWTSVGGNYISFSRVKATGWKYGFILNQSICVDVDLCHFESNATGGVWIVNGDDHTASASTFYSNRISITRCQFNSNTAWGLIDDGGHCHYFVANNFNGGANHIRIAGVLPILIAGSEFEGATGQNIVQSTTTLNGGDGVGASWMSIEDNLITPASGVSAGNFAGGGGALFLKNNYTSTTADAWINVGLLNTLTSINNYNPSGSIFDSATGPTYTSNMDTQSIVRFGNRSGRRTTATYGANVAITATAGDIFEITVTNNSNFQIDNPTAGKNGQQITIKVSNTSGGALGTVTWDTAYKLASWTNPATGNQRSITFNYDGTNWFELHRTSADVPN